MSRPVTAVVDILPTWGPLTRVRVNGDTPRDVEAALEALDEGYESDDMALVSIEGCEPLDIDFNEVGTTYIAEGVAPEYTVNAPHAEPRPTYRFETAGYIVGGVAVLVPVRVVCSNTLAGLTR